MITALLSQLVTNAPTILAGAGIIIIRYIEKSKIVRRFEKKIKDILDNK